MTPVTPSPTPLAPVADCPQTVKDWDSTLEDLAARLDSSMTLSDFSGSLSDVKAAFDKIDLEHVPQDCRTIIRTSNDAYFDYLDAQTAWSACNAKAGCTTDSIKADLQAKWSDAAAKINAVKQALAG